VITEPTTESTPTAGDKPAVIQHRQRLPRTGLPGQRRLTRRSSIPLFEAGATDDFRVRWLAIQSNFVDEPGVSVEQADLLVAEVMREIDKTFAEKRAKLEPQLVQGELSTEDLRLALRAYRSFFDRLLTI
jgi:hypothetical protein